MLLLTLNESKILSKEQGETNWVTAAKLLEKKQYIVITKEYKSRGVLKRVAYRTTSDGRRFLEYAESCATR